MRHLLARVFISCKKPKTDRLSKLALLQGGVSFYDVMRSISIPQRWSHRPCGIGREAKHYEVLGHIVLGQSFYMGNNSRRYVFRSRRSRWQTPMDSIKKTQYCWWKTSQTTTSNVKNIENNKNKLPFPQQVFLLDGFLVAIFTLYGKSTHPAQFRYQLSDSDFQPMPADPK